MIHLRDLLEAASGELLSTGPDMFTGVSIDSRSIGEGELFIALPGGHVDGHNYLGEALGRGGGALIKKEWSAPHQLHFEGKTIIAVADPLDALQRYAGAKRGAFKGPVVAVVGSNGKTTTKELAASVLSSRWRVHRTTGNLNNHIGMPLCICRMPDDAEALVLEMGTNRPGDIRDLCAIASPDIAVITNIGYEHIEGFGSIGAVRDAELEVLATPGTVIANADDSFLMEGLKAGFRGRTITFGMDLPADVSASDLVFGDEQTAFTLHVEGREIGVGSRLAGRFNVMNSLAAAALGHSLGLGLDEIRTGLEAFGGVEMRLEIRKVCGLTVLYDVYNANPSSMEASLRELGRRKAETGARAIAVLGDMLELGSFCDEAHRSVGLLSRMIGIDRLIAAGPHMAGAAAAFGEGAMQAGSSEGAGEALAAMALPGDIILFKGSRGMRMERAFDVFAESCGRGIDPVHQEGGA